jgi:uridylate kinase
MTIVLALGGSVVVPDKVDEEYVQKFAGWAKELLKKHKLGVVIGGGKTARRAVEAARSAGKNEAECDYAGIEASRENAAKVARIMGLKQKAVPENVKEARRILDKEGIVVMGGTEPGHSTDAVAAMLAEYANADLLLKVTDVPGIYDKDPKKFKEAKMFKELPIGQLEKMVAGLSQEAGRYELMDIVAVKILRRSGIRCIALGGRDLKNMAAAIDGKGFTGTVIA